MIYTVAMDSLWASLAALSKGSAEDEKVLHCVRLQLVDGATFDVYKAEEAPGAVTLWRVRGFFEPEGGGEVAERKGVILGTQDGRAIARMSTPDGDTMTPVTAHEPTTRALSDLSDVIAAAVQSLMDPGAD